MARVTVEDCVDKVESPYELVLVAKERATQLNSGIEPTLDRDNDKNTVIALREIAEENIKVPDLTESAVYKLRKHVEQIDDSVEDDEDIGEHHDEGLCRREGGDRKLQSKQLRGGINCETVGVRNERGRGGRKATKMWKSCLKRQPVCKATGTQARHGVVRLKEGQPWWPKGTRWMAVSCM